MHGEKAFTLEGSGTCRGMRGWPGQKVMYAKGDFAFRACQRSNYSREDGACQGNQVVPLGLPHLSDKDLEQILLIPGGLLAPAFETTTLGRSLTP